LFFSASPPKVNWRTPLNSYKIPAILSTLKKALPFAPAVLYYGLIFWFSSHPLPIRSTLPNFDKLGHCAAFGGLGFLLALGYFAAPRLKAGQKALWVAVTGAGLGILDEVHQLFVPGRTPDPLDALADAAGIGLGLFLYWIIIGRKKAPQARL